MNNQNMWHAGQGLKKFLLGLGLAAMSVVSIAQTAIEAVSGSLQGSVPLLSRELSAPAPRGSYNISVAGVNACGTGPATSPVTVIVP